MSSNGVVTLTSGFDVPTTVSRLASAMTAKGLTIFAIIDHADGAHIVGLELRPTTLIVFGNPKSGTPLMQEAQAAGIDLPLKVLVYRDENGFTRVAYNDPAWIATRHGLKVDKNLEALSGALATLTALVAH